jgi:hypothetical protein
MRGLTVAVVLLAAAVACKPSEDQALATAADCGVP